jgi:hypothetical protein
MLISDMTVEVGSAKGESPSEEEIVGEKDIEELSGGKGKEREKEKEKMSDRYNEDDADVTLLSSDGMIFKVHSFLLVRAS